MLRSPLARCSSPDLRLHQTPETASPTPPRSNSFVSSRRTGIVSEQDVFRLASVVAADDDRRAGDPRLPPWTVSTAQTAPSSWPAPVLRQRSDDSEQRQPRPLSTGYLPSNSAETQAAQRVQGPASQAVKANGVDTQVRHQNVALLPNRQLSQQPAEMCWRQWNSAPQRKGRPFGDVNASTTTPENGCRRPSQTPRRPGGRADEQQLLAEREAELRALRLTMERNEAAILRAMDDQRRAWEAEVAAERESWERRVRDAERQADDVRTTLTDRVRDLERQNAALQSANVEHCGGRGNVRVRRAANGDEQPGAGGERLRQPAVNGVDGPPRNFAPASTGRTAVGVRSAADQRRLPQPPESDGESSDASASRRPAIAEAPPRCRRCEAVSGELERLREEFDAERQQWLAEKRRVIAYQKLLQSKYVELERHCARLEGSTVADGRNRVETAGDVTPTGDADGHAAHGCWNSTQSSSSLLLPKFAFGQSIET